MRAARSHSGTAVVRRLMLGVVACALLLPAGCRSSGPAGLVLTGSFVDQTVDVLVPALPHESLDLDVGTAPSNDASPTAEPAEGESAGTALLATGQTPASTAPAEPHWERLAEVSVRPGDRVGTGDRLAVIDDALARASLDAAEADLNRSEADLALIESRTGDVLADRSEVASLTAETQNRITDLQAQRSELQTQLDAARATAPSPSIVDTGTVPADIAARIRQLEAAIVRIDAGLTEARDGLEDLIEAQQELEKAETLLSAVQKTAIAVVDARKAVVALLDARIAQATVTAPVEGIVVAAATSGEVRAAGAPLVTIRTLARPRVRTFVTAQQARSMRDGSPARVRVDSLPGEEFTGLVTGLGSDYAFVPTEFATTIIHLTRGFEVTVEVYGAPDIPPGTPADVLILADQPSGTP